MAIECVNAIELSTHTHCDGNETVRTRVPRMMSTFFRIIDTMRAHSRNCRAYRTYGWNSFLPAHTDSEHTRHDLALQSVGVLACSIHRLDVRPIPVYGEPGIELHSLRCQRRRTISISLPVVCRPVVVVLNYSARQCLCVVFLININYMIHTIERKRNTHSTHTTRTNADTHNMNLRSRVCEMHKSRSWISIKHRYLSRDFPTDSDCFWGLCVHVCVCVCFGVCACVCFCVC